MNEIVTSDDVEADAGVSPELGKVATGSAGTLEGVVPGSDA